MPALETYGAQPPIELIRQYMDFKGWYDRKVVGEFRTLVDINFICAMGPPGGGRNPVTPRLTRHFNFLSFTELENDSMKKIFSTIFNWWSRSNEFLLNQSDKLIQSSIDVYKTVCASLLPTPSKSHYTFNLRDLSKVLQGMLMMEAKKVDVRSFVFFCRQRAHFFSRISLSNVYFVYGIMKIVVYFKID